MTSSPELQRMQLQNGIASFEANDFPEAWQLLEPLSRAANAEAQYRCAIMAQNGLGIDTDTVLAVKLMKLAAEQNLGLAQHALGVMYLMGEGMDADPEKAVFWLERAGESGLAGSWTTLGMMYKEGRGVERSNDIAREYYQKAGFDPGDFA